MEVDDGNRFNSTIWKYSTIMNIKRVYKDQLVAKIGSYKLYRLKMDIN